MRGDNCTPFNSFKVGYAVPGGTIISQRVVLAEGWEVVGWLLDVRSGSHYFVPNLHFFDHKIDESSLPSGPPVYIKLRSSNREALDDAYIEARIANRDATPSLGADAPTRLPAKTLVAPCFSKRLST